MQEKTKKKNKTEAGISVVLIIGILAVVNFFSYQLFYRFDMTQNGDYSLSPVSKKLAGSLDDVVNIKAYFSRELPADYASLRQDVGDILDEYKSYADGRIRVEFIDPADDTGLEQELMMIGIPQLQFNVYGKDKLEVAKGYLGLVVQYGDNKEVIPVIQDTNNLEYQLSLAIKKVTASEQPVIGWVTSHGAAGRESDYNFIGQKLAELYEIRDVDLVNIETVPLDLKTLLLVGPKEKFEEKELKKIDAFLMAGKSLLIAADGVKVETGLAASPNNLGLNAILEKYGLQLNSDLVLDVSSGLASFTQGFIQFSVNYPFWPKITGDGFDRENAAVAKLEGVILPWASSVGILNDKITAGAQASPLLKTTVEAWAQTGSFDLNPQQRILPTGTQKRYDLAVYLTGKITSAYADNSTEAGRIILIGDSDFATDRIIGNTPDNINLFQNLVDILSLDEDLVNIRSKGVSDRPIKELADSTKASIRYANVFGLTALVILFGLVRYYLRRRSRFVDEL